MTSTVKTVTSEVAMRELQDLFRSIPVIEADHLLASIISRVDVMRELERCTRGSV